MSNTFSSVSYSEWMVGGGEWGVVQKLLYVELEHKMCSEVITFLTSSFQIMFPLIAWK